MEFRIWNDYEERYENPKNFALNTGGEVLYLPTEYNYEEVDENKYIVERCIRRKDSKGNDIFENDVVTFNTSEGEYVVSFDDESKAYCLDSVDSNEKLFFTIDITDDITVIDNVHDYYKKKDERDTVYIVTKNKKKTCVDCCFLFHNCGCLRPDDVPECIPGFHYEKRKLNGRIVE